MLATLGNTMQTASAVYKSIASNIDRSIATVQSKPEMRREIEYYEQHIGGVKSVGDLIANGRLYAFVMKSFGLEDMAYAKAYIRKVLEGGVDDRNSLANRLADNRYRELTSTFNFARYGTATTSFERTQSGVVNRYLRQNLEESVGRDNEGARMALYFSRRAPTITSVYGILADRAVLQVVLTRLQLPDTFSLMSLERQADVLSGKLNLSDFNDPNKLSRFLEGFTINWDIRNRVSGDGPATFIAGRGLGAANVSLDLLTRIQQLRLGGR